MTLPPTTNDLQKPLPVHLIFCSTDTLGKTSKVLRYNFNCTPKTCESWEISYKNKMNYASGLYITHCLFILRSLKVPSTPQLFGVGHASGRDEYAIRDE